MKNYNFIIQGKLIHVTASSLEEAEQLARIISKQLDKEE